MSKKNIIFLFCFFFFISTYPTTVPLKNDFKLNNAPVANEQNVTVTEQQPGTITLSGTDADDDVLSYSLVALPTNGVVTIDGNTVIYTSSSDTATSDFFTFKVNDGTVDSSPAKINITITAVNDSPVSNSQDNINAIENQLKDITLTASDPEGDTLSYILSEEPENGRVIDPGNENKTIYVGTVISSNSVQYISDSDTALSDSFNFKTYDGFSESNNASIAITIAPVNDSPIATEKTVTVTENVSTIIILEGTDPDGTIPEIFKIITIANGVFTDPSNNDQTILPGTVISGNKVTFTSKGSASSDSFTFTASDGLLESEDGTISIKIITDAPTANSQTVNVVEQVENKLVLTGSDKEGDPLTYIITVLPENGILKNDGEIINSNKLPKTIDNSKLFYTSLSDNALSDTLSFKVNDGISDSSPAVVTIIISPVNDKPTALPKTKNVSEQVSDNIILEGTDPDGDDLTYIITKEPLNGTYTLNANTVVYVSNSDTATVDSFKYKVNDGKLDSDIVDVQISIEPVNDVPTVKSQNLSTIEDIELKFVLEGEDVDGDKLTYSIEASPIKGEATLKDSLVTYIPNAGYYGTDSIIFKANDGTALSSSGFIKITITSNDFDEDGILNDFDTCPDTPIGSKVNTDGCVVFELPFNNNKVEVISATCVGGNDGSLSLSVEDKSHDYSISVNGNNFGQSIVISGDNKTASVTGLAKGTYSICFKVDGQADYEQCFEVAIGEPKALSAFIDVDNDKRTTSIQLGGSKSYNIEVNGERFDVKGDNFNTTLPTGLSIIKISTDLDCQGLIEREIFISEDIFYYPNPTRGEVDVFVNGEDKGVKMSVFTIKGDLVFTRDQEILDSRKTELDLSGVPSGTYLVTLEGTTVRKTFKIVKK